MTDPEDIINKAYKDARRKIINADLVSRVFEFNNPIPATLYEEIYMECCELYRIYEMPKSSVHKLIDDLLEGNRFNFRLVLCGSRL